LQGFLHLIELEWLDDRFDLFHSSVGPPWDAKPRLAARFRSLSLTPCASQSTPYANPLGDSIIFYFKIL
jgi:hypothetical protein